MNTLQQASDSSRAHATQLPGHRPHCLCHQTAHRGSKDHLHLDPTRSWQNNRLGASEESTCRDCIALHKTNDTRSVPVTVHNISSWLNKTISNVSWTQFFTKAMNQLTSLHAARYPSHAKISKFLNAANNHFKHQVKSHTRGRPYNKQPRGVTNRLKHSQPHHSAQSSKSKGKSNGRQSC